MPPPSVRAELPLIVLPVTVTLPARLEMPPPLPYLRSRRRVAADRAVRDRQMPPWNSKCRRRCRYSAELPLIVLPDHGRIARVIPNAAAAVAGRVAADRAAGDRQVGR